MVDAESFGEMTQRRSEMRTIEMVRMCGLVAALGAGAFGACPDKCDKACCAGEATATLSVVEPEDETENIVVVQDGTQIEIRVVDGKVSATVDGEKIDGDRVHKSDRGWVIEGEDGEEIVVQLPDVPGHRVIMIGDGQGEGAASFGLSLGGAIGEGGGAQVFSLGGDGAGQPMVLAQSDGAPSRGVIGVSIGEPDEDELEDLGIDGAVRIDGVFDGSPAERAGMREGDLIVGIGDRKVRGIDDLREAMSGRKPGQEVRVWVIRNGKKKSFEIELAPARAMASGEERVIELAAPTIEVEVEGLLEKLKDSGAVHLDEEELAELGEHLKELHVKVAPLDGKVRRRIFAEIKDGDGAMGLGGVMAPRLLVSPKVGVIELEGGQAGVGVFQFREEDSGGHGKLQERLEDIESRLERLERKLDRLIRAMGERE